MANLKKTDVSKMKVVDLRQELKSRGLATSGDKSELIARLEAVVSEHNDEECLNTPDEVLEAVIEEHIKSFDKPRSASHSVELASNVQAEAGNVAGVSRPLNLKRNISSRKTENLEDGKPKENSTGGKKIVLHRPISVFGTPIIVVTKQLEEPTKAVPDSTTIVTPVKSDCNSRLEMRARRFGIPTEMSESEKQMARKNRFEQTATTSSHNTTPRVYSGSIDKLKQRAARFGHSVSKVMTDIENKEKLEKRKAKFGSVE